MEGNKNSAEHIYILMKGSTYRFKPALCNYDADADLYDDLSISSRAPLERFFVFPPSVESRNNAILPIHRLAPAYDCLAAAFTV